MKNRDSVDLVVPRDYDYDSVLKIQKNSCSYLHIRSSEAVVPRPISLRTHELSIEAFVAGSAMCVLLLVLQLEYFHPKRTRPRPLPLKEIQYSVGTYLPQFLHIFPQSSEIIFKRRNVMTTSRVIILSVIIQRESGKMRHV